MDLDELLVEEATVRQRIDKLIENGKKTAIAKCTQAFFENRIADLKSLWADFCQLDLNITKALHGEDDKDKHPYIKNDTYGITDLKYSEYLAELVENLRKFSTDSNNPTPSTPAFVHAPVIHTQDNLLPKISLPKYDGDYDKWQSFHDLYVSLVHNNDKLAPVKKLYYLKSCLTGDAEIILRHTPITERDYEPAWLKLKNRYQNKRILVNHQLKKLTNQPKLQSETAKGIKTLVDTTEECIQQLTSLDVNTSAWDALLIYLLVQKLPFQTLKLWEEKLGSSPELPQYSKFLEFLKDRARVLESISDTITSKPQQIKTKQEKTHTLHAVKANKCPACQESHFLPTCSKFRNLNATEKRKLIHRAGRCLNCLSSKHQTSNCNSQYKCRKCQQKHHTSICNKDTTKLKSREEEVKKQTSPLQTASTSTSNEDQKDATRSFASVQTRQALLATALVKAETKRGNTTILRCLIDTGSQSNFISEEACKRLQPETTDTSMEIKGLNAFQSATTTKKTRLRLSACNSSLKPFEEEFLIIPHITQPLPTQFLKTKGWSHIKDIKLADPTFGKPGKIDALLGAKIYTQILKEGIRRGPNSTPMAINTVFGWILLGPTSNEDTTQCHTTLTTTITERELTLQLKRFWEQEEVPNKKVLTKEEQEAEHIYTTTYKRLNNGKYQVRLPFKNNQPPSLGESKAQALKRFINLNQQLKRKPELEIEYNKCLNEYITLGHMEKVYSTASNQPSYYIPHHAVLKDSTTTKLCVVFDASAKTSNGKSLNEQMLVGRTLQPKLFATLLHWRKYKYAMTADIEKMYRMIEIHPEQRTFQRILWNDPNSKQLQEYQLKTVTFGTSAAPYLAIRTLLQLANDEKLNYPLAAKAAQSHFYVDDLLTGAETVQEAQLLQTEIIAMLKSGGFNLRKWTSNTPSLLQGIPVEHREIQGSLTFEENESIKTLGIKWFPAQDYFTFKVTNQEKPCITKRSILSEIASLYDPLGWLAPVLITAKILMQSLWISGLGWDNQVSEPIKHQWKAFKEGLPQLENLKIPRWIQFSSTRNIQIHGFCDASNKAYAAVIYLRAEIKRGQYITTLLTSKTRVTPLKPVTIPRLELNGALLLANLIQTTINDMQLQDVQTFAWTDAMIVLQWIKEHPSRWKTYVANRVVQIQEILQCDKWQHISTKQNPADLASRGVPVTQLLDNDLWWHGPDWLSRDETEWPKSKPIEGQTELEAKRPQTTNLLANNQDNLLFRYSSYTKLIRVELQEAEVIVLKETQQMVFDREYEELSKSKPLSNKSTIIKLTPFLDANNLIRVGGRLQNTSLPYDRQHPIILPYGHHITNLIIKKTHLETLHGGITLVLNTIRNKFWPINARRCITTQLHKCIVCFKQKQLQLTQLMGNLPRPRVNISKPFSAVGIDYGGPIIIKSSNLRKAKLQKAYFCIFICMATRAIHIELVSDLTSTAFIAALKRFVSRRGLCHDIYSDCGTNFIGAKTILDKELREAIQQAEPTAAEYLTNLSISWHFNPPSAPHFGGLWEAGVKSIKYHLKRIVQHSGYTFEEYATLLTQIEACLNSRPLCRVQDNPDDLFSLTPGHFLIGQPLNAIPEPQVENLPYSTRWKHIQHMANTFWKHWSQDYLNQLQQRPKWQQTRPNINKGDIVIIKNENLPPTMWALGKVTKVYSGQDGLIRVAEVKMQNNTLQRPISKICKLPVE